MAYTCPACGGTLHTDGTCMGCAEHFETPCEVPPQAILNPNQERFLDINGVPVANGRLYVFQPGTRDSLQLARTTPVQETTYHPGDMISPEHIMILPNPIILDQYGRGSIPPGYRDQPVTVKLQDRHGVTVWTRDLYHDGSMRSWSPEEPMANEIRRDASMIYFASASSTFTIPEFNCGTRGTNGFGPLDHRPVTMRNQDGGIYNHRKEEKKKLKAECTAQMMLQEWIGMEQWRIYRRSNRVIVKPGKFFWIIGNYFGKYVKGVPFANKPDVIRIDDVDSGAATSFCVDQRGGKPTPYTDKVIAITVHLVNNEEGFYKMANKINLLKFDSKRECALWSIS